jgi:DNA-binding transcriptional regulator GbsR (MarR family)
MSNLKKKLQDKLTEKIQSKLHGKLEAKLQSKLRDNQKQLVERVGVAHEQEGLSPAAARVLGMLLVADETEHTFEEIQAELGLSKSAVSNALNFLLMTKTIDYITRPGDRRRYFRSALTSWPDHLSAKLNRMLEIKAIMGEVLAQRNPETQEFNSKIAELIDFMGFMNQEIPLLIEKWKASRK